MDRVFLARCLAQAEGHIARGEDCLARQRIVIDGLQAQGLDTSGMRQYFERSAGILEDFDYYGNCVYLTQALKNKAA
jgi:hypothetical protein